MRCVFMGTPEFSVPALDALVTAGHEVVAVYTRAPKPAGRGKQEQKSPVHLRADALGIPVHTPRTFKSTTEEGAFADLRADVAVVVAYGLILPAPVLATPRYGCINIHASLLPRWRGAAPIQRAIMAGDFETGISIMEMDPGLDTGPVLLTEATPIGATDTSGDLHDRLSEMGARLIVEALGRIDEITPEPQPATGATYAVKVDKSEARIDWRRTGDEIDRQIRSLSPFPGAWCEAGEERIKLLRSRAVEDEGEPGEHLGGFRIACGDGAVEVLEAQRAGKRVMAAEEFLRGQPLPDRLT